MMRLVLVLFFVDVGGDINSVTDDDDDIQTVKQHYSTTMTNTIFVAGNDDAVDIGSIRGMVRYKRCND